MGLVNVLALAGIAGVLWKQRCASENERSESVQGSKPRETIERRAASENPLRATTINDFAKLGTALG